MKGALAKLFEFEGYAYLYILCIILCITGLMDGYFLGTITGTEQSVANFFKLGEIGSSYIESVHSLVVASPILGCCIGALTSTYIRHALGGKKFVLVLVASLFIISAIGSYHPELLLGKVQRIQPEDSGWGMFISLMFFRALGGFATGISSVVSPLYMTELVPAEKRGKLVSLFYLSMMTGIMLSIIINSLLYKFHTDIYIYQDYMTLIDTGWRHMFIAIAFPAILMFAVVFVLPHSPRELILDGKIKEAKNTFLLLYGPTRSQKIMGEMQESFNSSRVKLFSYGHKVVLLCVGIAFCQQFVGYNTAVYFLPRLISELTGTEGIVAMQITVLLSLLSTFSIVITFVYIDKIGRKPLLIIGTVMMLASILLLVLFATTGFTNLLIMILVMSLYFVGYSLSGGSTCMVYIYEILPNSIRRQGCAFVQTLFWFFNLILVIAYPILYIRNQWIIIAITITTILIALLLVKKLLPETKGMTLEQIGLYWSKMSDTKEQ